MPISALMRCRQATPLVVRCCTSIGGALQPSRPARWSGAGPGQPGVPAVCGRLRYRAALLRVAGSDVGQHHSVHCRPGLHSSSVLLIFGITKNSSHHSVTCGSRTTPDEAPGAQRDGYCNAQAIVVGIAQDAERPNSATVYQLVMQAVHRTCQAWYSAAAGSWWVWSFVHRMRKGLKRRLTSSSR